MDLIAKKLEDIRRIIFRSLNELVELAQVPADFEWHYDLSIPKKSWGELQTYSNNPSYYGVVVIRKVSPLRDEDTLFAENFSFDPDQLRREPAEFFAQNVISELRSIFTKRKMWTEKFLERIRQCDGLIQMRLGAEAIPAAIPMQFHGKLGNIDHDDIFIWSRRYERSPILAFGAIRDFHPRFAYAVIMPYLSRLMRSFREQCDLYNIWTMKRSERDYKIRTEYVSLSIGYDTKYIDDMIAAMVGHPITRDQDFIFDSILRCAEF